LEYLINSNIALMSGYLAYLKTNGDDNQDLTLIYLNNLLANNEGYIRNIATLKDTTIIWNYPPGGNETSIGIDLATVDGQKEPVLGTKKYLKPSFQGPVDLVQRW
jgi:sensor domain CHASE-containing protein